MATRYYDPSATGANNGNTQTDAWTTLQAAFDGVAAADEVLCRNGPAGADIETLTATATTVSQGTNATGYISWIGVNAAWVNDGTRCKFDCGGNAINAIHITGQDMNWFENFEIYNTAVGANDGFYFSTANCFRPVFINCLVRNVGGIGFNSNGEFARACHMFRCVSRNNGGDGVYRMTYQGSCKSCASYDNTGHGFFIGVDRGPMVNCHTHNNGSDGFYCSSTPGWFFYCSSHGNTIGLRLAGTTAVIGMRLTNNVTGFEAGSNDIAPLGFVYAQNTTDIVGTRYKEVTLSGAPTLVTGGTDVDYGYIDSVGGDFNLADDATLRSIATPIIAN